MAIRKALSKKIRFDVFKRDNFTCIYCGNNPPSAILEVDHIVPVSKGGTDVIDNLATSCFDCNRGKSNKELTDVVQPISDKIAIAQERELQYKEYCKLLKRGEKLIQKQINEVSVIYENTFIGYELTDLFKNSSLKNFINTLGVEKVKDAMYKSCMAIDHNNACIKYFCGICWNMIKNKGYNG